MRLILLLFVSILVSNSAYTQEVSKHLSITNDGKYDSGLQCIPISDGFIILCNTRGLDSNGTSKSSIGLLRLDASLKPVWSNNYHNYSSEGNGMLATGTVMEAVDDTIYVAAFARSFLDIKIRMMAISLINGTLLHQEEIYLIGEYPQMLFDDMLEKDGHLILYSSLGTGDFGEEFLNILKLDLQFNVIKQFYFSDNFQTFYSYELKALDEGGYVLVYCEAYKPGEACSLKVARLDEQFNVIYAKEIPQTELGNDDLKASIHPTDDGGYFVYWHKNLRDSIPHPYPYKTSPFPPVVYKLDSLFNVEWEYVFVSTYAKGAVQTKLDSEGNLLSAGFSMSFYTREYFKDPWHKSDGWSFLMSPSGDLLWERSIADSVFHSHGGKFLDVAETDEGYLYVGNLQLVNPTGLPYPRDTDIWLVTLNKEGCWNGNCNPYIVINGDTTSSTNTKESVIPALDILAYPNPTNSVLNIECEGCSANSQRKVEVFGVDGSKMMEVDLFAPKSTINLSNLTNGTYFLVHSMDGRTVETHKVIVSH
jgi:hypothetical protein